MKYLLQTFTVILLTAVFSVNTFSQEQIPKSVLASGGERMFNAEFSLTGTAGQSVIGLSGNQNNMITSGFWNEGISITSAEDMINIIPSEFSLEQNYPNPFNPVTVIRYSVPERTGISIKIFNINGEEVASLINEEKAPGTYEIMFDGTELTSGVYIYRMITGFNTTSRKMMLIK